MSEPRVPPPAAVPTEPPAAAPPAGSAFWRTLRMVGWGFLGVRRRSEYPRDLGQVNPLPIMLAGLVGVLLFVLLLLGIIRWVVSGPAAAG